MADLKDIIRGFGTIRPEGSAFVVECSTSTTFTPVDLVEAVALQQLPGQSRFSPRVFGERGGTPSTRAILMLWRRRDGAYVALAPLSVEGADATTIDANAGGYTLTLRGNQDGPRAAATFAVAADPFVAADFCRAAANKVMGRDDVGGYTMFSVADADPQDVLYAAAVTGIWSRPVRLSPEAAVDGSEQLLATAQSLFNVASPMVTCDRLFVDPRTEPRLLKVFTHKGRDGVIGLFHTQRSDEPITDTWRPDDVEGLGGEQFVAWHAVERKLFIIDRGVDEQITLQSRGAELIHLVPILQNVAPLGLIDQLNSTASMIRVGSRKCQLSDGGQVGWYAAKRPAQVTLDGQPVAFEYDQASGLLTLNAEVGRLHDSEVTL